MDEEVAVTDVPETDVVEVSVVVITLHPALIGFWTIFKGLYPSGRTRFEETVRSEAE